MLAASLSVDVKAKDFGLIEIDLGWKDDRIGVVLKEYLWEGGTKVSTVDIDLSELGKVHFLASGAEDFEARSF